MAIRLNESNLRNIIRESIRSILYEEDDLTYTNKGYINLESESKQDKVFERALDILSEMGYDESSLCGSDDDNNRVIRLSIDDYSEASKVEKVLMRGLGVKDPFDLSVSIDTSPIGNNMCCVIYLPSWRHLSRK